MIGHTPQAQPLLDKAGVVPDDGVVAPESDAARCFSAAVNGRIWAREPKVRTVHSLRCRSVRHGGIKTFRQLGLQRGGAREIGGGKRGLQVAL